MIIRRGVKEDIPQTLELIKELAEYENALDEVSNTIEVLEKDGFGEDPVFDLFIAEKNKKIIGIALTFFRYSTWKGKVLYLEDLIVSKLYRRQGTGKKLFDEVSKFAKAKSFVGLSLEGLDWNEIGINFYKK